MNHTLQDNISLIQALQHYFPESSKRTLLGWVKWGRISVDGQTCVQGNALLQKGQILTLEKKESKHQAHGIPILYEDRWIVVIDKPAGLLSVPADNPAPNAFHMLKSGLKSPSLFPVHRLDQDSSGVLLFARSKMSEEAFNVLFEKHDLEREYIAILEGRIPYKKGTWENYLREKEDYSVEVTTPDLGRKATTHYELVKYSKQYSFLRLKLETGRKHQIRVQAAHCGYPILGDKRYGAVKNSYKRLCLHAQKLAFVHPFTQKPMCFISQAKYIQTYPNGHFPFPS